LSHRLVLGLTTKKQTNKLNEFIQNTLRNLSQGVFFCKYLYGKY